MKKIIRKHYFTLMEVMISVGLTMGVLAALMGFYSYVTHIDKKGKDLEKKTFDALYLQFRLTDLLPRTVPFYEIVSDRNVEMQRGGGKKEDQKKESEYNFFTSSYNGFPSLTFLFSGEASGDTLFSGKTLGRIFLNTKRQLCFAIFPAPSQWTLSGDIPVKMEVLAENVDSIRFSFFSPVEANREELWKDLKVPMKKEETSNPIAELSSGQWVTEWRNDYAKLPPLVRLEVEKGKETLKFVIPLVKSEYMIVYE